MGGTIELRAFMGLQMLFRERGWSIPHTFEIEGEMTGEDLLVRLDIPRDKVESFFINRLAIAIEGSVIRPGDRVALVPPGVPGPHRLLLGIHNKAKSRELFGLSH
ncbi:MoaD/ThiS family protein [Oryzibacter oryziterrae]|uniref:MoaD/ThiS family protein n=1 Tax=Oryzibacter oryziterrae TaxID=2766474 RepID=UPI001F324E50|nr:MoaD/ThiS family protein [Oryzibacter oryziterrae]